MGGSTSEIEDMGKVSSQRPEGKKRQKEKKRKTKHVHQKMKFKRKGAKELRGGRWATNKVLFNNPQIKEKR